MYLAKVRKQMEEQEMKEMQTKADKRSDSARGSTSQQVKSRGIGLGDLGIGVRRGSSSTAGSRDDFQPDDLPDGAFVSPKHTPTQMRPEEMTIERPAEYIGSFSVCGTDEDTRALQVETQLQSLQTVQQGKRVALQISLQGVRVSDVEDQTVLMHHELKRISYAACDPQHLQFSFLAREKHLNIQYCHSFRTGTPEQAEELNVIMGDAFKMAYANQRDTLPTFHELIEAQIVQQQARFREIERQAQVELQRKLAEIARPTPFSQQASQWLEQRKVPAEDSETELLVGKNKLWAKHAVEQAQHRVSMHGTSMDDFPLLDSQVTRNEPAVFHPGILGRRKAIGQDGLQDITSIDISALHSGARSSGALAGAEQTDSSFLLQGEGSEERRDLALPEKGSNLDLPGKSISSSVLSGSGSTHLLFKLAQQNHSRHNSAPPFDDKTRTRVIQVAGVVGRPGCPEPSTQAAVHDVDDGAGAAEGEVRSKTWAGKALKKSAVRMRFVRSASDSAARRRQTVVAWSTEGGSHRAEVARDTDRKGARDAVVSPENRSQPTAPLTATSPTTATAAADPGDGAQPHQRPALGPPPPPPPPAEHRHSLEDEDLSSLPLSSSSPSPLSGRHANGARSSPGKKPPRPSSDGSAPGSQVTAASGAGAGAGAGVGVVGPRAGGKRHDNWQLVDMLGTAVESKTAQVLEAEVPFELAARPAPARLIKPPTRSPPPEPPPTPPPPPESPPPPASPSLLPTPEVEYDEVGDEDECVWPDLPPPGDLIIEERYDYDEFGEEQEEELEKKIVGLESPEEEKGSECLSYYDDDEENEEENEEEEGGVAEGGSDDRSESPSSMIINEDAAVTAAAGWFSKGMMESSMSLDRREIEDPSLRQAPWYQPGIPREIALEILQQDVLGSFIVRDSATHLGCFALSVRVPESVSRTGVSHYVIAKNPRGFRLKGGSNKDFLNLTALVTYHTHTSDNMPCKLRLLHNARNLTFMAAEREDSEEDAGSASASALASISTTGSGISDLAPDDEPPISMDQLRL